MGDKLAEFHASHRPSAVWTLAEITTWVCSCGSSVRLVDWRNPATDSPPVSGCSRPPLERIRVVEAYFSIIITVAFTATS